MGDNLGPNGLSRGCKVFCSKVSEIVVHEADEPNGLVDFPDAQPLTCEHRRSSMTKLAFHGINTAQRRKVLPMCPAGSVTYVSGRAREELASISLLVRSLVTKASQRVVHPPFKEPFTWLRLLHSDESTQLDSLATTIARVHPSRAADVRWCATHGC